MPTLTDPNSAEATLTPDARALIARARRSFMLSVGILLVGLLAVGGVIVYKLSSDTGPAPVTADYALAAVKLPAGADVVSAVAADGRLTVTFKTAGNTAIRIFDGKTGEMLREIPVVAQ
ncbi:MAG: hypothetical protein ACTHNL_09795 [Devosia sp.]